MKSTNRYGNLTANGPASKIQTFNQLDNNDQVLIDQNIISAHHEHSRHLHNHRYYSNHF